MTPEKIARRLTPAQRRALLWLPEDGAPRHESELPARVRPVSLFALAQKAIGQDIYAVLAQLSPRAELKWPWRLTPLGQQVRAIVEREGRDA